MKVGHGQLVSLGLGQLIQALKDDLAENGDRAIALGFAKPHSYRWDYADLAFEPAEDVTVSSMLEAARNADCATYQGYKGGDYTMDVTTDVYLARYGEIGTPLSELLLSLLLDGRSSGELDDSPNSWAMHVEQDPADMSRNQQADRLLDLAWGVITNAGLHGDGWLGEHPEWVQAAVRWREDYHAYLGMERLPVPSVEEIAAQQVRSRAEAEAGLREALGRPE